MKQSYEKLNLLSIYMKTLYIFSKFSNLLKGNFAKKKKINKIDAKNAVLRMKVFFSFELHSTKGSKTTASYGVTRKRLLSLDLKPFR